MPVSLIVGTPKGAAVLTSKDRDRIRGEGETRQAQSCTDGEDGSVPVLSTTLEFQGDEFDRTHVG